jgi:aspartate racemase
MNRWKTEKGGMNSPKVPNGTARLGILGGMGPFASADFVRTIYECNLHGPEQESPRCVLLSEPAFPDRTQAILTGDDQRLRAQLEAAIGLLLAADCQRIVLACVTLHHCLDGLPRDMRSRIISLVDVAVAELQRTKERSLMLCTVGTRHARIFERHPDWPRIDGQVVLPDESDQLEIHQMIYRIKQGQCTPVDLEKPSKLAAKYSVPSVLAGCTELHVLNRCWRKDLPAGGVRVIDPLMILASNLRSYLA